MKDAVALLREQRSELMRRLFLSLIPECKATHVEAAFGIVDHPLMAAAGSNDGGSPGKRPLMAFDLVLDTLAPVIIL